MRTSPHHESRFSMNVEQAVRYASRLLEEDGVATPRLDAELLLAHLLGTKRMGLYVDHLKPLSGEAISAFETLIRRRLQHEPLAYIVGEKEFWSRSFRVFPGVLIPRPETELVVEKIIGLSTKREESIVDVGTGCGAIAIALAGELPSARLIAIDVSRRALKAARLNAASPPARRIRFVEGRAPAAFKGLLLAESQDFIVSNPPYISERDWRALAPEIRLFEPKRALVSGPTGFEFFDKLIRSSARFLKPQGHLVLEIGHGQREGVLSFFDETWADVRSFDDLSAIPRVVVARKK